MTWWADYNRARTLLTAHERQVLAELSPLSMDEDSAITRYGFYRRRGIDHDTAFAGAIAWARNAAEQAERRRDHGTGDGPCP